MVTTQQRRAVVTAWQTTAGISERRACRLVHLSRAVWRYEGRRPPATELCQRLRSLAAERPRWGVRRLHWQLQRDGAVRNHKRTERLYRLEGLQVRRRRRRHLAVVRVPVPVPTRPNVRWSADFVSDTLADGRGVRCLTLLDDCARECPAITVARSLPAPRVTATLDAAAAERGGYPDALVLDNGPEFTSLHMAQWARVHHVQLIFIEPGKPNQNPFIESFNGRFRDECLNENFFTDVTDAGGIIEAWRVDYNQNRPHQALGLRTPAEYVAELLTATPTTDDP